MGNIAAVILAAGQGTRMRSALPKVLHPVLGLPMVLWSVQNARALGADPIALVVGVGADAVRDTVGSQVLYATQAEQLGTGHAALQAKSVLQGRSAAVLLLYGDMPALRRETLEKLVALQRERRPAMTMLTAESEDSMGFGRVVRDAQGKVREIVEEAVATPAILALRELNCGVYCFDSEWLWRRLPDVPLTQPKGEYYLTDMVSLAVQDGLPVEALTIRDVTEVQGINTRVHLARCEKIMRERLTEQLMLAGVTCIDPATTYVEAGVQVGRDTTIYPNTYLSGNTKVGERCTLGPNTIIHDSTIGCGCRIVASVLESATVEDSVDVGPYSHLRPGAHLGQGVHVGNFGEVKNAYLGPGARMGHFGYIGDAELGEQVNVGAGTVTCNYDGVSKHRTVIERQAFVGSGAMLVAPLTVGRGARIGAGSVVTRDVPAGALVYGVPARVRDRSNEGAGEDEQI